MDNKKHGGPAFPLADAQSVHRIGAAAIEGITDSAERDRVYIEATARACAGMTLRDYFAIRAPEPTAERISMEHTSDRNRNPYNDEHRPKLRSDVEIRCDLAYEYADAMIRARGAA
ncbi:hypothetical protein [Burkholderia cenocepacia]|uniref:hypothetical protein n=1 Tax=Burkholderia cenocepacia TaxID=95486 RepID=UPI00097C3C52|nr:hypothetical protein [Burkholderia cenocepacia]AQQ20222.1 hypothetical protein A8D61_17975 [Burkholderia cenocepacia]ONJ19976.1 hypothetical protein A8D82_13910 [Burkholderia cenocepacia]ONN96039.1 hypothetical protein A8D64_00280 [Burkholderia cenocepacia]ONO00562.1 hypothetical protein A8D62_00415 [Burkholderia cenocepacia]ONO14961.1 hypothetical protein A8D67_04260 [Burkholderia cenocepacia]